MDLNAARTEERPVTPPGARAKAFRVIAMTIAVLAVGFGLFTAAFGILSEGQGVHAFHNTVLAALLLLLSAPPAIAAARAPHRAGPHLLHLGALGVAALATMALALRVDIYTLPFVVLAGVLLLLRAHRSAEVLAGRPSPVLGLLVAAAAVPLVAYALGQAELQRIDPASEHAQLNHWMEMSFFAAAIPLLGSLVALRPGVFRLAAWGAGGGLSVMGGASLALQEHASALDPRWAWVTLVGGAVFVTVAEWRAARDDPEALFARCEHEGG
jgi:hypothetical protein